MFLTFSILLFFLSFLTEYGSSDAPGFGQQPGMAGAQPMAPTVNPRQPMPTSAAKPDPQSNQKSLRAPALEDSFLDHRDNGHQNSAFSRPQAQVAAGQKAIPMLF